MDAAGLAGMDNHLGRPEIREAGLRGWGYSIRYSHTLKKDMVYLAVPIILQEKRWGYCRVAWPMSAFYSHQKSLAAIIVLGLLASGILLMAAFGRLWQNIITDIGRGSGRPTVDRRRPFRPLPHRTGQPGDRKDIPDPKPFGRIMG